MERTLNGIRNPDGHSPGGPDDRWDRRTKALCPTFETNIQGTWCLLEARERCGRPPDVVVASSDKAYGGSDGSCRTRKTARWNGRHPYDVSKSCADILSLTYCQDVRIASVRSRAVAIFTAAANLNWNRIIPGTIRSVLLREGMP